MNDNEKTAQSPGKESLKPVLPRRFYKKAASQPVAENAGAPGPVLHAVTLDGRTVKTPKKAALAVPGKPLADTIAAEWEAQTDVIDPRIMPLTRLANSIIDGVVGAEDDIRADLLKYGGNDLLCYRAEGPQNLVQRQGEAWDPILGWARSTLGARLVLTEGVMPVTQPANALDGVAAELAKLDAWRLAPVHVVTTLTGSLLLALALARGHLTADELWRAAHVDEDWQIEQWGEDAEAAERRQHRRAELAASDRLLALVNAL